MNRSATMPQRVAIGSSNPATDSLYFAGRGLFYLSLCLAMMSMLDPTSRNWGMGNTGAVKYLPIIASLVSIFLSLIANPSSITSLFKIRNLAILVLFAFMLHGSSVAQEETGRDVMFTYLGRALNIIPFFAGMLCMHGRGSDGLEKTFGKVAFTGGFIMIVMILLSELGLAFGFRGAFQNQAPLAVAFGLSVLFVPGPLFFRIAACLMSSAIFLTMGKYTTVLWAVLCLAAVLAVTAFPWLLSGGRSSKTLRGIRGVFAISGAIAIVVLGASLMQMKKETASTDARWPVFQKRIEEFTDSPIYGSNFESSPLLSIGNLVIPTHNDYLEILSGGGSIALALLLIPVGCALSNIFKMYKIGLLNYGYRIVPVVLLLTTLVNMMSNPMLFLASTSYLLWSTLGMLSNQPQLKK